MNSVESKLPQDQAARPLFIVLEGIDGSGSTTQGDRLSQWLRERGHKAYFTHQPSGGPAGMLIRLALSRRLRGLSAETHDDLNPPQTPTDLDPYTLALLYAADRMDHVSTEILPNLSRGTVVVCDRYLLSTLAYQGLSVPEDWLLSINRFAPKPDLCIFLDVPVEYSKERMKRTRWTKELYEGEDTLRMIRERYLRLITTMRDHLGDLAIVDATQPISTVAKKIRSIVESRIAAEPGKQSVPNLSLF